MFDVNGDTLAVNDLVKIWNDKNGYIWRISETLNNGCVIITRGLDDFGIIQPEKLTWVTTPKEVN